MSTLGRRIFVGLALTIGLTACRDVPERLEATGGAGDEGARAMIERLSRYVDGNDYTRLIVALDTLPPPDTQEEAMSRGARRAYYLLQAGRHSEASAESFRLLRLAESAGAEPPVDFQRDMRGLLALAAVWGAFEDACMADADACLFPLEPRHFGPEVTPRLEAAITFFGNALDEEPDDEAARWLLNLAHMALGTYPEGVPPGRRISPDQIYQGAEFTRFRNRAAELGVDLSGHAGGVVFDDLDGDLDADLLVSSRGLADPIHYFENRGGTFVDRTRESGLEGLVGGLNLVHADYDNDGDSDVLALRGAWTPHGQPNSLFRNEGGGRFVDVTEEAGVLSVHPGQAAAWGDFDNDGWLDLVIGNEGESREPEPREHLLELYRNDGDGTFTNVAAEAGLAENRYVKAVSWGDFDNDGRLDLLISAHEEDNALYRNDGPDASGVWRFTDVTERAGIQRPISSFPAWWFDFDNDGWLDAFIAGYKVNHAEQMVGYRRVPAGAETLHLYLNRRDGTFEDASARVGLDRVVYTMGSNFGDLDNDGWLDFYLGTGDPDLHTIVPNVMFRNAGGRAVEDVSVAGGFSHMAKGHAVAFTDVDHDGDQDIYAVLGGAVEGDLGRNALWENPGHGNRWITLLLEGVESNRSALHARIRVTVDTPGGPRDLHRVVGSGGSFGASSLQQEIGLGAATAIREIEIRWPGSGRVEILSATDLDRAYRIREGSGELVPLDRAVVRLGSAPR